MLVWECVRRVQLHPPGLTGVAGVESQPGWRLTWVGIRGQQGFGAAGVVQRGALAWGGGPRSGAAAEWGGAQQG